MNFSKSGWRRLPRQRALNVALAVAAMVPLCIIYRSWFSPWAVPVRGSPEIAGLWGDFMNMFAAWHRTSVHALYTEHTFPLWNRFVHAGEPLFAKPQVAVLNVATLLGAVLPFPISIKLDVLFHVGMAALGTVVLLRTLGAHPLVAMLGAALYLLNPYYIFHIHRGHLNFVTGFAYVPWWLWALYRALRSTERRPLGWALVLGILGAGAVYEGGDVALLYGAMLLGCAALAHGLTNPGRATAVRIATVGGVAGLSALGMGAFKLLPLAEYMRIGNRRLGVPWEAAAQNGEMLSGPAVHVLGLALCALALLCHRRQRGWAVGLLIAATAGYAASHNAATFRFFYDHVPLVNAQRHPQRAEAMMVLAVPALWGLAAVGLQRVARLRWWVLVLSTAMAGVVLFHAIKTPTPTPVTDARVEPAANPLMARMRTLGGDGRVQLMEATDRHWGMEHVTVPNGVENLLGTEAMWLPEFLSPQFYMPQQWSYLDAARFRPARIWGLLSVTLVASQRPVNVAGLQFVEHLPPCPACMPRRSAGPFLYRNLEALPTMLTTEKSVLFAGTGRNADLAWQSLLVSDAWDPTRVALIRAGLRDDPVTAAQVEHADLVLEHTSMTVPASLRGAIKQGVTVSGTALDPTALAAVEQLGRNAPPRRAVVQERDGSTYRGCTEGGRTLVASSKWSLVGGWHATTDDGDALPIWRANGVATAVPVPQAPACVTFTYRPTSILLGLGISLTSTAAVAAALVRLARQRKRRPRPAAAPQHAGA